MAAPRKLPSRRTVTLQPYYWAAYNEIVKPNRIGWYLAARWLPTLKPLGYALIGALRARCYHNTKTGELRNQIQIDMEELAEAVGVSRTTLWREFRSNTVLSEFVRRQDQYVVRRKGPQREDSVYFVAMDDPIHPNDLERYEALRQAEAEGRAFPPAKVIRREEEPDGTYKLQGETYRPGAAAPAFQNETAALQNATGSLQSGTDTNKESLSLPLYTETTAALAPSHRCGPPEGEAEEGAPQLWQAWQQALQQLSGRVNTPTFETHIRTLRPLSLSESGEVLLAVPSAFTRGWIEKRHLPNLEEALSATLGRPIAVRLTGKEEARNYRLQCESD